MTEDIKHIDEKSQEYIAEGNRMTDRYSSDCYTVAYITKLKKENERLKTLYRNEGITDICEACSVASAMEAYDYYKALEKIRTSLKNQIKWEGQLDCCERKILNIINEVLNDNR